MNNIMFTGYAYIKEGSADGPYGKEKFSLPSFLQEACNIPFA